MKNLLSMMALILLFSWSASAQNLVDDTKFDFVVWSASGDVTYSKQGSDEKMALNEQDELKKSSTVYIGEGSSLTLLYGGQQVEINEAGAHSLADIAEEQGENKGEADPFLMGVSMAFASGGGSQGGMGEAGPGIGWGKKDWLKALLPNKGKVTNRKKTFSWVPWGEQGATYKFTLSSSDNNPITEVTTAATNVEVNLKKLTEEGESYSWQVEVVDGGSGKSKPASFEVASKKAAKQVVKDVKRQAAYKAADKEEKMLRQAKALEQAGFLYQADEQYGKALSKFPDSELANVMYFKFKRDHGLMAGEK